MKKVLCIGNAAYDITFPLEDFPIENIKYRVNEKVEGGGGPASNAAYLLGKWNVNSYFAGVLGEDTFGRKIEQEFKSVNVNTKYLEFDEGNKTTLSFIIVNKDNGSRTVFAYKDQEISYDTEIDEKFDVILIDGHEYEKSVNAIKNNPQAKTLIDAGRATENVISLCKMVDYVVCSKDFAEAYTKLEITLDNKKNIKEIFKIMKKDFKNVVITLEDKGCLYEDENIIKLMPSKKVKAKDSTGAGDFFHGAFAYCLLNDFDIEKTVKISNITGALSVMKIGSRNSAPTLDDVMEVYNVS